MLDKHTCSLLINACSLLSNICSLLINTCTLPQQIADENLRQAACSSTHPQGQRPKQQAIAAPRYV